MRARLILVLGTMAIPCIGSSACGAEAASASAENVTALVGQAADIAPSAYLYRADRKAEENPPETAFLFSPVMGHRHGRAGVLCALLWEEPRPVNRIELIWPKDATSVPGPEGVAVRWMPHGDSSSWWGRRPGKTGKSTIVAAEKPVISANGRVYAYAVDATKNESAFDNLVVAVTKSGQDTWAIPTVRVLTPEAWKTMDIEIEWGLRARTEASDFDGRIEAYNGIIGKARPLAGDAGTRMTGGHSWQSQAAGSSRRGLATTVLHLGVTHNTPVWSQQARVEEANRTIITVRTKSGAFSFMPADLETGPILAPECGFFVARAGSGVTAAAFERELASKGLKTIRQCVRQREEQTWDGAMKALHGSKPLPPYPKPEFEPMAQIDVPESRLNDAWRVGAWHLLRVQKKNPQGHWVFSDFPYDTLAHETHLILRVLDLMGMPEPSRDGLAMWLEATRKGRLNGMFTDMQGCLLGIQWDNAHCGGAGLLLWQMAEHYAFTGDKDWLRKAAPKLQAHADWIIRQRHSFMKDLPGRERLWTHGLLPPHNIWDSENWRPWYETDTNCYLGLKRFAEVIADVDADAGQKYLAEAEAYGRDLLAAAEKSFVLSPVIRVRDGTYRSFIPPAAYIRGPASRHMPTSFGSPEHTPGLYADAIRGGVHFINRSGLLPPTEPRAQGLIDVLEDRLLSEHHRLPMRTQGYDREKDWFGGAGWYYQCGIERTPDVHLQWDDVPNFLRSFFNHYAVNIVVGPYTFNEHTTRGPEDKSFEEAAFLERLRNLLVMEQDGALWLAKGTARAWLAQGKKIAVKDMPTRFGTASYEIVSDVDNGKIVATVKMPSREAPKGVLLRLRHPKAAPIKSITVNGSEWKDFDAEKGVVKLHGLRGSVAVDIRYTQ